MYESSDVIISVSLHQNGNATIFALDQKPHEYEKSSKRNVADCRLNNSHCRTLGVDYLAKPSVKPFTKHHIEYGADSYKLESERNVKRPVIQAGQSG